MSLARIASLLVLLLALPATHAGSNAHRPRPVGWEGTTCVPGFDPTQGWPSVIELTFQHCVSAQAPVENLGSERCEVAFTYATLLRLGLPDGEELAIAAPSGNDHADLWAFDGTIDGAGRSGRVLGEVRVNSQTIEIRDPKTIAHFARPAGWVVELPVEARGWYDVLSADGIWAEPSLCAGVRVTVSYLP